MSLLSIILIILLFSLAYAAGSGAPWVPTFRRDIERVRRMLDLRDGETFVELGCGDGRVVLGVTKGTLVRAVGVELSILQWVIAQVRRILARSGNTSFVLGNLFAYNLRDADAVYFFLIPETYEKLRPKLEAELKPGARVISFVWPIQGWTPVKIDVLEGASKIYLYVR